MMTELAFLLGGVLLALALPAPHAWTLGFAAQRPADHAAGPAFDLRRHPSGPIPCEGVIHGPAGRVTSRFAADMEGAWDGQTGTLAERFHYDSGLVQDRCWTLHLGNDGRIRAEAPDVVPGSGSGRWRGRR